MQTLAFRDFRKLGCEAVEHVGDLEFLQIRLDCAGFEAVDVEQRSQNAHMFSMAWSDLTSTSSARAFDNAPQNALQHDEGLQRLPQVVARRSKKARLRKIGRLRHLLSERSLLRRLFEFFARLQIGEVGEIDDDPVNEIALRAVGRDRAQIPDASPALDFVPLW